MTSEGFEPSVSGVRGQRLAQFDYEAKSSETEIRTQNRWLTAICDAISLSRNVGEWFSVLAG